MTSIAGNLTGCISATACFAVIITFTIFSDIRKLRYVELVFYVALNDFVASIGISLGSQPSNSFLCAFQAVATNLNYVSAVLWTTVITFQVWKMIYFGTVIRNLTPFLLLGCANCYNFSSIIFCLIWKK
jgi:hypothetical protein